MATGDAVTAEPVVAEMIAIRTAAFGESDPELAVLRDHQAKIKNALGT